MNNRFKLFGFIALYAMITIGMLALSLASCDNGGGDPELPGTIAITPDTDVAVGDMLTANYNGTETVSYQWKMGSTNLGTATTQVANEAGSYTVTVSADGFKPKTSAAVTVSPADPNKVAIPTANPPAGAVASGTTVTLSTTTAGADIWYTTGNSAPAKNGTGSTKYASPIAITAAVTIKAIAVKDGMTDSNVLTAAYTISSGGNPIKSVSVGAQSGTPTAGTAGAATFTVTTANIASGTAITLNNTNTVAGITLGTTATSGNSTNVSINTTAATPQGSHPLTLTIDGTTSSPFNLAVSAGSGGNEPTVTNVTVSGGATSVEKGSSTPAFTATVTGDNSPSQDVTWTVEGGINGTSISTSGVLTVAAGETASSLIVRATSTVAGFTDISGTATVSVTEAALDTIAKIRAYLNAQTGGTSAADPIPLKVEIGLGNMTSATDNWQQLLGVLNTAGKYVDLDLSDSEATYTVFNPVSTVTTGKDKIVAITLPEAGETITAGTNAATSAFAGFTSLASVTIPDGYTAIPDYAFNGRTSLKSVTIGSGVTSIVNGAFTGCTGLTDITVDSNNPNYASQDGVLYNKAKTEIVFVPSAISGSVTIPETLTAIPDNAFQNRTRLASVTIGDSVTTIGQNAFNGCRGLTSVDIPDGVESIGNNAFSGCTGLASVTIGDSVTSIGSSAFSGCSGLTSITIPDGVESIGSSAFSGCTGLESITIPFTGNTLNGTTNTHFGYIFGGGTNYNTPNPQNNSIPASLKTVVITGGNSIPASAFSDCTGLTSVTIGSGVETIGYGAFSDCTGLTSVTIGDSVTTVNTYAFYYCTSLTSIDIPNSVTSIGSSAFQSCTSLTSIDIPNSVTSIDNSAFLNCRGLISVTIGSGVMSIGNTDTGTTTGAFQNCTSLTSVTIGSGVETIGNNTFYGCTSLTSVTFERVGTTFTSIGTNTSFPNAGSLNNSYRAGGIGTYTRTGTPPIADTVEWVKQ